VINYVEKGFGLHEFLAGEGVFIEQSQSGKWVSNASDERTNNLIASYNPWLVEKAKKIAEATAWFESEVAKLTVGTTQTERDSWSVQVNEAYGLRPISMLASMAEARGIEVNTLVEKVKRKAELFAEYYGAIQGKRDAIEDQIKSFPNDGDYHRLAELWAIKCTG
jgi:hypothetical protein